jgi:hypothetical protein
MRVIRRLHADVLDAGHHGLFPSGKLFGPSGGEGAD